MPSQITVTYISAPPSTTSTQTLPIPTIFQTLDSGQTVDKQTGFNAFDTLAAGISKRGGLTFTDGNGVLTFIPLFSIIKITAS